MQLFLRPWRHYGDFSGRSRRGEFGLFFVGYYGVLFVIVTLAIALGSVPTFGLVLAVVWLLAGIIPSWAVTVRRLHDQDKSGWFLLLTLIPYVGFLFWLAIAFWPGTRGENDYGLDPRDDAVTDDQLEQVFS